MFGRDYDRRSLARGVDGGGAVGAGAVAVPHTGAPRHTWLAIFADGIGGGRDRNGIGAIVGGIPAGPDAVMVGYRQDVNVSAIRIGGVLFAVVRRIVYSGRHRGACRVVEYWGASSRGRSIVSGISRRLGHGGAIFAIDV
jgi:hypothetical protein